MAEDHRVPSPTTRLRTDAYCLKVFPSLASRSQSKRWIKRGHILCNGEPTVPERFPAPGDVLSLHPPETVLSPLEIPIEIAYMDRHMAVAYKPAGLHVGGNHDKTLRRALLHCMPPSTEADRLAQPEPVHRLDFRTQGLVVVARTAKARAALGDMFARRRVQKRYTALAEGSVETPGSSRLGLDGRDAHTLWRPLRRVPSLHVGWITLLEVEPETGRTHQIRRHLHAAGHPILGDDLYPGAKTLRGKGLFLASTGVRLPHPFAAETIHVRCDPPRKFDALLEREERRWRRSKEEG